jgi:phosphatidylserine/phosphatidylglycerophosphate/cardiolipin synthase-like enzyme
MTEIAKAGGVDRVASSPKSAPPKVTLLDNQSFAPALEALLAPKKGAISPVSMIEYNFFTDNGAATPALNATGQPTVVLNALKALGSAGTPVMALLEGTHAPDIATRNGFTENLLTQAKNVKVVMNDSKSNGFIDHAKMTVRGNTVIAGSHNLTQTSMTKNNEVSLEVVSRDIANAARNFIQACADPARAGQAQPVTVTDGNITFLTDTAYEQQLLDLISSCGKGDTLVGSMYDFNFTSSDASAQAVMKALVAAETRGVKLTLLLDHEQSQGTASEDNNAAARTYLMQNAPPDNPPTIQLGSPNTISHQKFIIKNASQVLMGSTNWTDSDFNHRHQVDWLVNDSKLALTLQNTLLKEMASPNNSPIASAAAKVRADRFDAGR